MKTTIKEQRDVMPQWLPGGNNLGDYTVTTERYTGAGLIAFMQEKPVFADAVAQIVAGQSHIMFGSKMGGRMASEGCPEKGKEEKDPDWRERVYEEVKKKAKEVLPGAHFDYCAELRRWAEEEFAERGQKKDKREVLSDYYKIVASVEKGWDDGALQKRENLAVKLGFVKEFASKTAAEFVQCIALKYRPEKVEVKEDDLF